MCIAWRSLLDPQQRDILAWAGSELGAEHKSPGTGVLVFRHRDIASPSWDIASMRIHFNAGLSVHLAHPETAPIDARRPTQAGCRHDGRNDVRTACSIHSGTRRSIRSSFPWFTPGRRDWPACGGVTHDPRRTLRRTFYGVSRSGVSPGMFDSPHVGATPGADGPVERCVNRCAARWSLPPPVATLSMKAATELQLKSRFPLSLLRSRRDADRIFPSSERR